MKAARTTILVFTIISAAIICGFINISAGYAFCCLMEVENQKNIDLFNSMGNGLLLSSLFLILSTIIAALKKVWLSLILNIFGSGCYIYTVAKLYAIPNTALAKEITEPLAERHLSTVIVSLLLIALSILNYFDETNLSKRINNKYKKDNQKNRNLTDDEKIL